MKKWQSISEDTEANLANAADGNKAPFFALIERRINVCVKTFDRE